MYLFSLKRMEKVIKEYFYRLPFFFIAKEKINNWEKHHNLGASAFLNNDKEKAIRYLSISSKNKVCLSNTLLYLVYSEKNNKLGKNKYFRYLKDNKDPLSRITLMLHENSLDLISYLEELYSLYRSKEVYDFYLLLSLNTINRNIRVEDIFINNLFKLAEKFHEEKDFDSAYICFTLYNKMKNSDEVKYILGKYLVFDVISFEKNIEKGILLLKDSTSVFASALLGILYSFGIKIKKDKDEGLYYLNRVKGKNVYADLSLYILKEENDLNKIIKRYDISKLEVEDFFAYLRALESKIC